MRIFVSSTILVASSSQTDIEFAKRNKLKEIKK
jgi:hypothetical protein